MAQIKFEHTPDRNNLSLEWEYWLPSNMSVKLTPLEAKKIDKPEGAVRVIISANLFHLLLTNFDKLSGTN